jgi:hypothetical protein
MRCDWVVLSLEREERVEGEERVGGEERREREERGGGEGEERRGM